MIASFSRREPFAVADQAMACNADWLLPCMVMTTVSAASACVAIPDRSGMIPALMMLPLWLLVAALVVSVFAFFSMARARVGSPVRHIAAFVSRERGTVGVLLICLVLAGFNLVAFMWIKPLLNYRVSFWADPFLADADHFLFLGRDPWTLLSWLNSTPMAIFYHQGWFLMLILALLVVAWASPSPQRSAVLVTYFLLWSVIGPMIHVLLPAAGPVFYAQLGYGSRFAGLAVTSETREAAAYLWALYSRGGFGPAAGISAMPSMHIATTVWVLIAFRHFGRRWLLPMALAGLLIFLLSIALGWHYATDGVVGGVSALLCYHILLSFYRRQNQRAADFTAKASSTKGAAAQT